MHLRTDIQLLQIGEEYILVDPGKDNELNNYICPMNEAAAMLWVTFQGQEADAEAMADVLCEHYEVNRKKALQDIKALLTQWKDYQLLV